MAAAGSARRVHLIGLSANDAPEVKGFSSLIDYLVVHGAAVKWMGMANEGNKT